MNLGELRQHWQRFGHDDPLWAVLTLPGTKGGRWDTESFFATGVEEIDRLMSELTPLGVPAQRRRAMDFGCGVGRLTQALCRHFEHVDGLDIAASMLERARALNQFGDRCHYVENTTPDLS